MTRNRPMPDSPLLDRVAYAVDDNAFVLGLPVGVLGVLLIQDGHQWPAMALSAVTSGVVAHFRNHEAGRRERAKIDQ